MCGKIGSLVLALGVIVLCAPRAARAQTYDFATCDPSVTSTTACSSTMTHCCKEAANAGSSFLLTGGASCTTGSCAIVIPMDFCHQGNATSSSTSAPTWCGNRVSNDGSILTYGLIYRLLQNGIPVYWAVNPSKYPVPTSGEIAQTVDMWILDSSVSTPPGTSTALTGLGSSPAPVKRMKGGFTSATFGYDSTYSYAYKEFPIRGSAFFISASDRANFNKFVNRQSPYTSWAARSGCYSGTGSGGPSTCYDFTNVNMFEIQPTASIGWTNYTGTCSGSGTVCEATADCGGVETCKFSGSTITPPGTTGAINFRANEIPIGYLMNYAPPKVARFGSGGVAQKWLGQANLEDASSSSCASTGIFTPSDAVYCAVSESNIASGVLTTGSFGWLWLDHQALTCSSSGGTSLSQVESFLTAVSGSYTPGNVMAIADGIDDELCSANGDHMLGSQGGIGLSPSNGSTPSPVILRYPQSLFMQWGDLPVDFASGTSSSGWALTGGGIDGYTGKFGSISPDSLHRLVSVDVGTTCTNQKSSKTCDRSASSPGSYLAPVGDTGWDTTGGGENTDVTVYGRYRNVSSNGIVYYLPGTQIQNHAAELRMLLDSVLATPLGTVTQVPPTTIEATRSSPVIASIANRNAVVQGTYEYVSPAPAITTVTDPSDVAAFEFPYQKGHFRAVDDSSISSTGTSFSSGTVLFDSAKSTTMPTVSASGCTGADGSCRYIFTTITSTFRPTVIPFDETHRALLVSSLGINGVAWTSSSDQNAFIDKILAGHNSSGSYVPALGGVDRSTAAVIGPSPLVSGSRPTIAYFGATDGMLHAVCASISGACTTLGRELWAYIPRTNLPLLRLNTARIDGSPRVVDALVDVTTGTGTGTKAWRTILTFQTGTGDPGTPGETPAVYALDVSDPFNPVVLWEYDTPTVRGTYELGQGLTMAANQVTISGASKWMAYAQTNNGGTGSAATVVVPIDMETGTNTLGWKFTYAYPDPPRSGSDNIVPSTGIPGGVVPVFATGSTDGIAKDLVFGDLYGDLWEIDPATGTSKYTDSGGTGIPLFTFESDYHAIGAKPALYSDGTNQYAVFATGGYADPSDSVWGTGVQQYLMAVTVTGYATTNHASLTDTSPAADVPVKISLGANEKSYAQAVVVGTQIFVTTDSTDVNSSGYGSSSGTGHLYSYDFNTSSQGTTVVLATGGASSATADSTNVYVGSNSMQQLAGAANTATGNSVDSTSAQTMSRTLWLRTE